MYTREHKLRKTVIKMDPDCAICHRPATAACECEAKGLDVAIKQAEDQMMRSMYNDIRLVAKYVSSVQLALTSCFRTWVRARAQDYILEYFRLLADRRKAAHRNHIEHITQHAWIHYRAQPHPHQIADAQASLKRGIDEDWQSSVQRYPEVLTYFFGLVELSLPHDDDPSVRDPPLSALNGHRKPNRRSTGGGAASSTFEAAPALTNSHYLDRSYLPTRTPPPVDRHANRTPGRDRDRRAPVRHSLPPQPPNYYAPYMP
jgi:hypothetical protein